MSAWNHSICEGCWNKEHPDRPPFIVTASGLHPELCCYCGGEHASGIYVREDPMKLKCQGTGGTHATKEV